MKTSAKPSKQFNLKRWLDSDDFHTFLREFDEQERAYARTLETPLREALQYERFYLADRDDLRGEGEDWRANVHIPTPYYTVETKVGQLLATLTSSDPLIQAIGQSAGARKSEEQIEKLLENTLWANHWRTLLAQLLRMICTQSAAMLKVTWKRTAYPVMLADRIRSGEWYDWIETLKQAEAAWKISTERGIRAPGVEADNTVLPQNRDIFESWRRTVNDLGQGFTLAPYPLADSEVVTFEGPHLTIPSLYDMRFDPYVSNVHDQERIMERIIRPKQWLLDRAGNDPDDPTRPFSMAAVEHALGNGEGQRFNDFQREHYAMLGLDYSDTDDPRYVDFVELFEDWQPNKPKDTARYSVVLNRQAVINWDPTQLPYYDEMHPYLMLRNVHLHGSALGMNELKQAHTLFHEIDTLHNLNLDMLSFAVMPVFGRTQGIGIPDLQKTLRPGAFVEMLDPSKGIKKLFGDVHVPPESFRAIDVLSSLVDQAFGTTPNVRGQQAEVGRVTAVESESRFKQASQRLQTIAIEIEDDLALLPHKLLSRWYQFGDEEIVMAMSGGEKSELRIPRTHILEALRHNYQFRGATQALGRSERINEMMAFMKQYGAVLAPDELRVLAKQVLELAGMREPSAIINAANTKVLMDNWKAKMTPPPPPAPPEGAAGGEDIPQVDMGLNEARQMLGG